MKNALGSCSSLGRAGNARTHIILAALLTVAVPMPAVADETPNSLQFVIVPIDCTQLWQITGSPSVWDRVLSFAACIQDATVARVERIDQLEGLVEQMQAGLDPSILFYAAAIDRGPGPVKVRATYQIGLGQVALMTRARASIVTPPDLDTNSAAAARHRELHARLERLLEPHAKLAWLSFTTIDRAVTNDPDLAPDVVTQNMVRSARELASLLVKSWPILQEAPLLAGR